ncbi:autotransporter assembly complex family protein [uncultured Phenylobacterium sp.]|uniref:autotransporter assembly complex protein TamA n=1 Tax=uncultured Phenylobacterium sp. TaxID=349273 RepID=UPI0025F8FA15|nr:autotransporter assembly complex family protein [uncultured Phenylobacterium sp.]
MGRLLYAVAATAALCAPAAQAAEARATVQGEMDPDLKALVERVIGNTDRPIENRFEARRRARAAAEDAIAVLRSEGYYAYRVQPEVSEADPPRPLVEIAPGPRFRLGQPTLDWRGRPPSPATQAEAARALALSPGGPGRSVDIIAAEGRAMAAVQKRGYADAVAEPREVVVDHADTSVTPTYRIAAGALVRLEGVDLAPGGRTNPAWVRHLAPWAAGDPYDPDDVAELERRLLDTGVYDSVTVALAGPEKARPSGLRPVVVALSERKPRTIEGGASYSTSEGVGVNVRWTNYNRLARADTLSVFGQLSDRDSRVGVDLTLPHWLRPQQTFKTGVAVYDLKTDAFREKGLGVRADVTRRYGRSSYVTVGASANATRSDEIRVGTVTSLGRDLITLATLGDVLLDRSNDPLSPTTGWRLSARLEPTLILGDTNLPYLRAVAQGTYYQPLDKLAKTVIAGRLRAGRILNGTVEQIPASQRFYAGGGGSVRGFPYQAVGPRLADNTPKGGVFLLETSLEVRREVNARWSFATFVDAGSVGSSGAADVGDLAVGAGIGVRYNLGLVPIRIDLATPVVRKRGEPPIQVYVSIGQSF